MSRQTEPELLDVVARAPFKVYYEGPARVVSGLNKVGQFDILPGHADFFSILSAGEVIIETDKEALSFDVNNGIVTTRDNKVMLFLNM